MISKIHIYVSFSIQSVYQNQYLKIFFSLVLSQFIMSLLNTFFSISFENWNTTTYIIFMVVITASIK